MLLQFPQMRRFICLFVITNFIVLFGWQTTIYADELYYKIIDVAEWDVLNIRTSFDYRSEKIGHIPPNEQCVLVIGKDYASNDILWFQVDYKGMIGWVNSCYMVTSTHCGKK